MAQQKQKPEAEQIKRTVYPYYSLNKAIELAEIVRDHGGVNTEVPKSLIAQHMQTEETSPTLNGVLGAAKLFDLVDGRGMYRLTETAKKYFFPATDSDQRVALLDMVNGPPLFRSLITKFDGTRLPPQLMLTNILNREYGIAESWRVRAATLFISSMQRAEVIDSSGFLRYSASVHSASSGTIPAMSQHASPVTATATTDRAPIPLPEAVAEAKPRPGMAGWTYRGMRVEVPENLSRELWEKLNAYINVLKPEDEE